ncbi:MAG: hypothetical protein HRU20_21535 [Pseudomonadales bacterium]|nr:hypothetical protein [Pseudomonadales bacterium]
MNIVNELKLANAQSAAKLRYCLCTIFALFLLSFSLESYAVSLSPVGIKKMTGGSHVMIQNTITHGNTARQYEMIVNGRVVGTTPIIQANKSLKIPLRL